MCGKTCDRAAILAPQGLTYASKWSSYPAPCPRRRGFPTVAVAAHWSSELIRNSVMTERGNS
jgi:hypothetical protein